MKNILLPALFALFASQISGQSTSYWQQHVDYTMSIDMDVETFKYEGVQELVYTNNSPDTLSRVYYHLFFNAFQPGSQMDARLQSIADPDNRMIANGKSRIMSLNETEIGFLHTNTLKQDGQDISFQEEGTILVVDLAKPLLPGKKTTLSMTFSGQVPEQIRRSGRNSSEGVALSMTQWYPKLCEYDFEGWHPNPYIAREFHGVWGDFDVKITLDKNYILGGSGYLQNPNDVGYGYEAPGTKIKRKGKTLTWHFIAPQVHDFTWAADPEYLHDVVQMEDGPTLHFLYKNNPDILENWKNLQPKTEETMRFLSNNIGKYPYKQYSVIQGGDGGMEYAMCTLITGERKFPSLVGVMVHEMAHSWFQHVLATNESKHEWMDEGFTTFISSLCMNEVMNQKKDNPFGRSYSSYFALVESGREMPQGTHADRYASNFAYGISAYSKGSIFLPQLGYVIGQENLMKTIRKYFDDFKFKHPTPNDIKRTAEKVSGFELDWYLTDWTQTTNTIDYAIDTVQAVDGKTKVVLERKGLMPMPIDLLVVGKDGTQKTYYIPLQMMRGEKTNPYPNLERVIKPDWGWAHPKYELILDESLESIEGIAIDPSQLMADVDSSNNVYQAKP